MFRTVFPSIFRSSRLYIQQQAFVRQILLLLASKQTAAFYKIGPGGPFSGAKRPGSEADHSTPSSVEAKNELSYNSTTPYAFMACTGIILLDIS